MKIRRRLTLAFLGIAATSLIVGVAGVLGLVFQNDVSEGMYRNMTVPLGHLLTMTENFQRIRVDIRDYVQATAPDRPAYLDSINNLRAGETQASAAFARAIDADQDQKLFDAYTESLGKYFEDLETIQTLVEANKLPEARALLRASTESAVQTQQAIDGLVEAKQGAARDAKNGN